MIWRQGPFARRRGQLLAPPQELPRPEPLKRLPERVLFRPGPGRQTPFAGWQGWLCSARSPLKIPAINLHWIVALPPAWKHATKRPRPPWQHRLVPPRPEPITKDKEKERNPVSYTHHSTSCSGEISYVSLHWSRPLASDTFSKLAVTVYVTPLIVCS